MDNAKIATPTRGPEAEKQLDAWQATIDRLESDPAKNEGRKELLEKAKDVEHHRDEAFAKYHAYETSSLIVQLGIVLASVALLSSAMVFAYAAAVLGGVGLLVLLAAYSNFTPVMALLH